MAVYTVSPFAGPVIGPLISGFINQNTNWRWTYYTQIIWTFCELVALIIVRLLDSSFFLDQSYIIFSQVVPETYAPAILKKKAQRYGADI